MHHRVLIFVFTLTSSLHIEFILRCCHLKSSLEQTNRLLISWLFLPAALTTTYSSHSRDRFRAKNTSNAWRACWLSSGFCQAISSSWVGGCCSQSGFSRKGGKIPCSRGFHLACFFVPLNLCFVKLFCFQIASLSDDVRFCSGQNDVLQFPRALFAEDVP